MSLAARVTTFETDTDDLNPIFGLFATPVLSFEASIDAIPNLGPLLAGSIKTAQKAAKKAIAKQNVLNADESCAIHIYTQESPLYHEINDHLRGKDRNRLKPFFPFIKLFLTAMYKLPYQSKVVWRGAKIPLPTNIVKGEEITWWSITSTTSSVEVLESELFLGRSGPRTIFNIEALVAIDIKEFSSMSIEDEFILLPGSVFDVISILTTGDGLSIVHLKQQRFGAMIDFPHPEYSSKVTSNSLNSTQSAVQPLLTSLDSQSSVAFSPFETKFPEYVNQSSIPRDQAISFQSSTTQKPADEDTTGSLGNPFLEDITSTPFKGADSRSLSPSPSIKSASTSLKPLGNADETTLVDVLDDCLPAGWESRQTSNGRIYFAHRETKTTTWQRPTQTAADPKASVDDHAQSARLAKGTDSKINDALNKQLPKGWEARVAPDGKVYFVNHETKKTTWLRPMQAAAVTEAAEQKIVTQQSASSLPVYELNSPISTPSPSPKDSTTATKTLARNADWKIADALNKPLPKGWEARLSEKGHVFFVNHVARTTTWERPTKAAQSQADENIYAQLENMVTTSLKLFGYYNLVKIHSDVFGDILTADNASGVTVAINQINLLSHKNKDKLLNDFKTIKRLKHKNIVEFLDGFLIEQTLWVIVEFMAGGTLRDIIAETIMNEGQIAAVSREILQGLEYIHGKFSLHQNINSDIILLGMKGEVKISFGVCAQLSQGSSLRPAATIGDSDWITLEALAKKLIGPKDDIWGLGILIIEMVEGEPPRFGRKPFSPLEVKIHGIPSLKNPERMSIAFKGFLAKCVEPNVAARVSATEALKHDIFKRATPLETLIPLIKEAKTSFAAKQEFM